MYFLGVDGGGTKTTAILADIAKNKTLAIKAGPGNIAVLDRGSTAHLLRTLIAGLSIQHETDQIQHATFAFAGAGRPNEKQVVCELISALGINEFAVMTDAEILYYSIFEDQQGILVHSGTGSFCMVRNAEGRLIQLGGRGYLLGDEGSGFDIGRMAIQNALYDDSLGKSQSILTKELLAFYGIQTPGEFISIIYSSNNPPNLFASCAALVCDLAEAGNKDALQIIEKASSTLIDVAIEAVGLLAPAASYDIALTGGVIARPSILQKQFRQKADEKNIRFQFREQEFPPAAAALLHSLKMHERSPGPEFTERLKTITYKEVS